VSDRAIVTCLEGTFVATPDRNELAQVVQRWNGGDAQALEQLTALLYDELRLIAHSHLLRERDSHTLSTTALVHEAYVQLAERTGPAWQGRAQFFALISRVMRHVLVDYARRRNAAKRGGGELQVDLDERTGSADAEIFELLSVNQALDRLAQQDERLARVVECRFFGGMRDSEIAEALGISERTVEREWRRARAYLFTMLAPDRPAGEAGG
jgi:RNA polymerase sigma factor (TIGR02999 family)